MLRMRRKTNLLLPHAEAQLRIDRGTSSCLPLARIISLPARVRRISVINSYPMIPNFRLGFSAVLVEHNQFCFLRRHVAVDAIVGGAMSFGENAGLGLVAAQTSLGKFRSIMLHPVHIV